MAASLHGRTIVMSGGSRGIGLATLVAAAREGANAVLLAKTDTPDPRLPGTVHTAVSDIEAAGGRAVAVVGDVRRDEDVQRAVETAVTEFGGIDIVVNNASAIALTGTEELSMKRFDLMQQVNIRGTYAMTRAAIPYLRKAPEGGRILTLSPPLNLRPEWLGAHPGYTLAKYGMTLLTMGWAHEFAGDGVAATCLWPQTTIATAAIRNIVSGEEGAARSRSPEIMADAAVAVLSAAAPTMNGRCLLDVEVLAEKGVSDLGPYGGDAGLDLDLFVDPES